MPLPVEQYAIPQGSTVLVTGVNGFIASHVADQFLQFGFKVRGTTRNTEKNAWVSKLFNEKYGPDKFELVAVPDMVAPGAFVEAVKGVAAVIHTATIFTLDPNPHNVIPGSIAGVVNAMEAASHEPSVKRLVFTSSSLAAVLPKPDDPSIKVTTESWNDIVVDMAYRDPPYEPERAVAVYAASKVLSEKAAWKFMAEKKPHYTFNAVLPNLNFGPSLDVQHQGHPSTSGLVSELFKGNTHYLGGITPRKLIFHTTPTLNSCKHHTSKVTNLKHRVLRRRAGYRLTACRCCHPPGCQV
jgi:nucleoside-diphosphate-sugar epimerase